MAADHLPDRLADHADRRAAPAAAHGRRGGRRAPLRVHRASLAKPFWIYDFGLARSREAPGPSHPEQVKALFEDALMRALAGEGRGRRLQRPGPRRPPDLAAGDRAARLRQVPAAGRAPPSASATSSGCWTCNVPIARLLVRLFESRFDPRASRGEAERSEAIAEEIRGQLDEVAILDHDRILRSYLGLILATLRTTHSSRPATTRASGRPGRAAVPRVQAGRPAGAGTARAPAAVRAVRVLAAAGGRAPAVRLGGAWRPALVRPAGGLPHRDPRPGQGAGGEELGHRPVRGQGRVRLQAPARPGRPRGLPGRGAGLLQDVHPRPCWT